MVMLAYQDSLGLLMMGSVRIKKKKTQMIGLITHVRGMNLWFNECHRSYLGLLLVVEKIVKPYRRKKIATAKDIRNGSKNMMKLNRARLERTVSYYGSIRNDVCTYLDSSAAFA